MVGRPSTDRIRTSAQSGGGVGRSARPQPGGGGRLRHLPGPGPSLAFAVGAGLPAGLFWVAASFGINYLFARRRLKLFAVDGGYHTLQFVLYGLVLGLWP